MDYLIVVFWDIHSGSLIKTFSLNLMLGEQFHPICYFSKKFSQHQTQYSTIKKEALSLLLSLQHFEVYVGSGQLPIVVNTDYNPLVFLAWMRNENQRFMR